MGVAAQRPREADPVGSRQYRSASRLRRREGSGANGRRRVLALAAIVACAGAGADGVRAQRSGILDAVPASIPGERFVVRHAPADSLRARGLAELFDLQPPLPGVAPQLPRGVTVVLAPDEATFGRAAGGRPPDWSAAVAIPALDRIVFPPFNSDRARGGDPWRTVRHEWAHLGLRQALPGLRVPRWFDEGYAQWAAGWNRAELWRLRLRVALGRTPPLDSLSFRFPGSSASARDAYLLSATTVEYLVDASGEAALDLFLERWRRVERFDEALRAVYGVSTAQLEEDWRDWLKDRYGWLSVVTHSSLGWAFLAIVVVVLFRIRRVRDRERLARLRAVEPPPSPEYWRADDGSEDEPGARVDGYQGTTGADVGSAFPRSGSR